MKQKSGPGKVPAEQMLKDIRRQTRRHYSAEEKIRIVLQGCAARRTSPSYAAAKALPR
jgi:transposase-like protein